MSKVKIKIKSIDDKYDENKFGLDFSAKGEANEVMSLLISATSSFAVETGMDEKILVKYVKEYYKNTKESEED